MTDETKIRGPSPRFDRVQRYALKHAGPVFWCAALGLSIAWTMIWLGVFFVTTTVFNLDTSVAILLLTLWLSVIVEAPIRYLENSDLVAYMTKPHMETPKGDNQDFKAAQALGFLLLGLVLLCTFLLIMHLNGRDLASTRDSLGTIIGPTDDPNAKTTQTMLQSWLIAFRNPTVWWVLVLCTLTRAWIYRRKVHSGLIKFRLQQIENSDTIESTTGDR